MSADPKSKVYLNAVFETLKAKAIEYHDEPAENDMKLKRARRIKDAILKLAQEVPELNIDGTDYGCPEGQKCIEGACVSNGLPFNDLS